MGKIIAVCISEKKGTVKKDIGEGVLIKEYGLKGDAHAGSERQLSLLSADKVEEFRVRTEGKVDLPPGVFGENLLVEGFDFAALPVGSMLRCGDVLLKITQIGKLCHSGCEIMKRTGECIMPKEGVFARVLRGGRIRNGMEMERICYKAAIITASDRSYSGQREDKSGPKIEEMLLNAGYEIGTKMLLPDDEEDLTQALINITDNEAPDVIFTTGGTGLSPRDHMPEATMKVAHRNVPGIAEALRAYSLKITPNAMLSRAVSVIRNNTLIVNLPGSPKAVAECLEYLLPVLDHGLEVLRGEATE